MARSSCAVGLLAVLLARDGLAFESRVDASVDAQFYALRSPFADPFFYRRRYTSTLGLELYDLQGPIERDGPRLTFRSRLRVDADFAQDPAERDPQSARFVPGLTQAPVDVMYAYLEARSLFRGLLGFRLGRQYLIDALGYWSFDGGLVSLEPPIPLALSGYLGFEQRAGLPMLAGARFSGDGVWRGRREDLEVNRYPAFLEESALAPALGAVLETRSLPGFHTRLNYRRVLNRSAVLLSPFFEPGSAPRRYRATRTSSERIGWSANLDLPELGTASGRAVYDIFNQLVSEANFTLDWFTSPSVVLGASLDYFYPTFDGDSIFNWFAHSGMTTAEGRVSVVPQGPWEGSLSGGLRWSQAFDEDAPSALFAPSTDVGGQSPSAVDVVARGSGSYRSGLSRVGLDVNLERGDLGHRIGAQMTTRRTFSGGRYDSMLLVSLYDWDDALRPTRSATSFSYVVGAGLRPGPELISRGRLGFEWEHSINRLVGHRFRLLLTLDFTVLK